MSQKYLLLPPNHTPDDSSIWRCAIQREFKTLRGKSHRDYLQEMPLGTRIDQVYYYGNTLHEAKLHSESLSRAQKIDPRWPLGVSMDVLGRNIDVISYCNFTDGTSPQEYFVKCVHEKWFKPGVYSALSLQSQGSLPDDMLHVQPIVEFVDEVRCFVLDGAIVTWSYYFKNKRRWEAGQHSTVAAKPEWQDLVNELLDQAPTIPRSIVVDIGLMTLEDAYGEGGSPQRWHVIEINEPWASGIYDCNPYRCLDVILANQDEVKLST